jgi:hypothetical protein
MNCLKCKNIGGDEDDTDAYLAFEFTFFPVGGFVKVDGFLDAFGLRHLADHLDGIVDEDGNPTGHINLTVIEKKLR